MLRKPCQLTHQVLLGHADDAGVGAHHEHAEVGRVAGHPEDGRLSGDT